jgi:hypothetical protein
MVRKRAAGGGRKPKGEFSQLTSSLTIRIPDDMRRQLESEAAENNSNVGQTLMWHLRQSFNRERDKQRDPALQGLLFMIAQLAERISGGQYTADAYFRSLEQREWRTDLFKFRAFKFAVGKLLDALEEPPAPEFTLTKEDRERIEKESAEKFGPEITKLIIENRESPENLAAFEFKNLWSAVVMSKYPFTEEERRMMHKHPILRQVMEREYYGFQRARKALELKPPREDLFEAIKRIMKDRNLDPENEPTPPDILEAMELIVDKGRALGEAADKLPAIEGLKLLESDPVPTLDEALKLIKIRKSKGKADDRRHLQAKGSA